MNHLCDLNPFEFWLIRWVLIVQDQHFHCDTGGDDEAGINADLSQACKGGHRSLHGSQTPQPKGFDVVACLLVERPHPLNGVLLVLITEN